MAWFMLDAVEAMDLSQFYFKYRADGFGRAAYDLQRVGEEPFDSLTQREREVLKLLAEGKTHHDIADQLFISVKTVLGHKEKIMHKLDIHNRTDLIKYAIRQGIISVES